MLCYAMLCYVMLCYVMLCYVMLCYVMLRYVTLRYVTLRYVTLCYVMLPNRTRCPQQRSGITGYLTTTRRARSSVSATRCDVNQSQGFHFYVFLSFESK
jgi:hypothetical protein